MFRLPEANKREPELPFVCFIISLVYAVAFLRREATYYPIIPKTPAIAIIPHSLSVGMFLGNTRPHPRIRCNLQASNSWSEIEIDRVLCTKSAI